MSQSVITEMTKKLISNSFKKILSKKSFNKITVKDIVDDSQLTRQTFYYHFQDIYELLQWTYKDELGCYLNDSNNSSLPETMKTILAYIKTNKSMFKNTIQVIGRDHFEKIIYPDMHKFSKNVLLSFSDNKELDNDKLDFISNMFTLTLISMIIKWTDKDMKKDPDECLNMLNATMNLANLSFIQ
ncbi:hypothetical protein SDC9_48553 [bioreactor metagenome]|uniref:HTH tetR-type domain-containing protein n=1 Tax=bioreactor metagenome TaxID=1076179 RepID=A0A644WFN6_9ZZZZ